VKLFVLLLCVSSGVAFAAKPQNAIVVVPIADVWSRPLAPNEGPSDDLRETQVLAGEKVIVHESSGPWARIEAVEQPEFTHHNLWEGYPGWVLKNSLGPPKSKKKAAKSSSGDILAFAASVIGTPYLWGGLSNQGFDCSGLVHLAYRQHEMTIPRDSYEQWMKAKRIPRAQLEKADLIFTAKVKNPKKITHVALYAGDGQIIEAPQTGLEVRKIAFEEKYGVPIDQVESGDIVGERVIYFGSFLH
jgi:cell wall-associated NlpC family hydrolase